MGELLKLVVAKEHHRYRCDCKRELAKEFAQLGLNPIERMCRRFEMLCHTERAVILPNQQICMLRTIKNLPSIFLDEEWKEIREHHYLHELGFVSNLSPNYYAVIGEGLLERRKKANYYEQRVIDALIGLTDKYCEEALRVGRMDLVEVFTQVPRYPARNFKEALQFFRILHFGLWLEGNYHNTVGRFDKYMIDYLKKDMASGIYDKESALALLEDFFISFNLDSDLYVGQQQGDNGQSMMLGGLAEDGSEIFNELTELCLKASYNNKLIDPKINLRVSKKTPEKVYTLASQLTKAGLGFPQYSNDDVVIPGLMRLGYAKEDAQNYTVAACWEFIIPFVGTDIANIAALSFPKAVDMAVKEGLVASQSYSEFMEYVKKAIFDLCDTICQSIQNVWFVPSPLMNVLMDCDIYQGGKYNNFGIHGTGASTAADSIAAMKQYIFEEKYCDKERLINALENDFLGEAELLHKLRYESHKVGNNDDYVDGILVELLDWFSEALEGRKNCSGGTYRAGTGSAMYYLSHAAELGASPDGRRKNEPLGTNFSISLFAKVKGPMSVIASMSKPHFERAINGGPLTLEFTQSLFTDDESIQKVGMIVKNFIDRGGHQLQLNAVNRSTLLEAQKHPEAYQQVVVRVWGWSGYFVELDKEYQDHVLARQEYAV